MVCEKLAKVKPALNVSIFSTGSRMSMFLVCFHQLMQLKGIVFVRKASLYILNIYSSMLLFVSFGQSEVHI